MPLIRPTKQSTNTTLGALRRNHPERDSIGIDMSILLIQAIKSSPTIVDRLFTEPKVPIGELNEKMCKKLETYVKEGFRIYCVFDGLPGTLKKNHAYLNRYGNNQQKESDLKQLYLVESFASAAEEKNNIKEAKGIRKDLATFNRPDLLFELKQCIKKSFGEKAFCIGSAFESDHQLGALIFQKVIDYGVTDDSDLSAIGTDIITNTKSNGQCWFQSSKDFLQKKLPDEIGPEGKEWSRELLHHVSCFLGNDFIGRVKGNSLAKLKKDFVKRITTDQGVLKSDEDIFDYISTIVLKTYTDQNEKYSFIKKWKHAKAMFSHGPAFLIEPTQENIPIDQALSSGNFTISLGSMGGGTDSNWILGDEKKTQYDGLCDRVYLVGFNPDEELRDALGAREEFRNNQNDDGIYNAVLKKVFCLEVWSKKGQDIVPLEDPTSKDGRKLFHGSVLDFKKIPPRFFDRKQLEFWCQIRQIKPPDNLHSLRSLCKVVSERLGEVLEPIPKEMMRGCSGYCSPELLIVKEQLATPKFSGTDEALNIINNLFPTIDDDYFTRMFGKRNGTRKRILMHIEGGSFDINEIKVTSDLICKRDPEKNLVVISAGCAPSQKLKEGNKDKFYEVQLAIEVDSEGKFSQFSIHPYTRCACPNGCIFCAHIGALILLLSALKEFDDTFEEIRAKLPSPVNNLLIRPMISRYAFPSSNSKAKKDVNYYRRSTEKNGNRGKPKKGKRNNTRSKRNKTERQKKGSQLSEASSGDGTPSDTSNDITITKAAVENGITLDECHDDLIEYAVEGVIAANDTPPLAVVAHVMNLVKDLKNGRDSRGVELKSIDGIDEAIQIEADLKASDAYELKQLKVMERMSEILDCFRFQKLSDKNTSCDRSDSIEGKQFISCPEPIIAPVLKYTHRIREKRREELLKIYDIDKVDMEIEIRNVEESDLKKDK